MKPGNSNVSDESTDSENAEFSMWSQDLQGNSVDSQGIREVDQPDTVEEVQNQPAGKSKSTGKNDIGSVRKTWFLDPDEIAPGSWFENDPNTSKKEDTEYLKVLKFPFPEEGYCFRLWKLVIQ